GGDVHALRALPLAGCQGTVHVDGGLLEEGDRLRGPGLPASVVDDVQQGFDTGAAETAAEVTSGSRIGEAAGTQSVEEVLILATQFEVLQAGGIAQGGVSEGPDGGRLGGGEMG